MLITVIIAVVLFRVINAAVADERSDDHLHQQPHKLEHCCRILPVFRASKKSSSSETLD